MVPLVLVVFFLFVIGISLRCVRRAKLDKVRQDIYRLREGVHDRIIDGELSIDDQVVSGFLHYLNRLVGVLEELSIVDMLWAFVQDLEEQAPPLWLKDGRLKEEAEKAVGVTVDGVLTVSWLSRLLCNVVYLTVRAAIPLITLHRRMTAYVAGVLESGQSPALLASASSSSSRRIR